MQRGRQSWQPATASHKCKVSHAHTRKLTPIHASSVQTQWFIYIKGMTQNWVLISMQNVPKTSNGRLWGGRERSHIKGINRRHNLGSTWAIFHLNHIAQHLVFNTLILRRLLLLQLARSPFHNVTNSITSTAVHEVLVSPSPLSLTCLLSFSCWREVLTQFDSSVSRFPSVWVLKKAVDEGNCRDEALNIF